MGKKNVEIVYDEEEKKETKAEQQGSVARRPSFLKSNEDLAKAEPHLVETKATEWSTGSQAKSRPSAPSFLGMPSKSSTAKTLAKLNIDKTGPQSNKTSITNLAASPKPVAAAQNNEDDDLFALIANAKDDLNESSEVPSTPEIQMEQENPLSEFDTLPSLGAKSPTPDNFGLPENQFPFPNPSVEDSGKMVNDNFDELVEKCIEKGINPNLSLLEIEQKLLEISFTKQSTQEMMDQASQAFANNQISLEEFMEQEAQVQKYIEDFESQEQIYTELKKFAS
jgi:hypothetical protein